MNGTKIAFVTVTTLLLALGGCDGDNDGNGNGYDAGCPDAGNGGQFRLATVNGGLARGDVEFVEERAPHVISALAELDVDLLCVQEFWLEFDALASASATRFPHATRLPAREDCSPPACSPAELDPLQTCVEIHCPGMTGSDLTSCAMANCMDELSALSPGCVDCAIAAADGGIEGVRDDCLSVDPGTGVSYLYNCEYDTGILTNASIVTEDATVLDSYLVAASVTFVRVDTPVGELDVFCTHLASDIPAFEYLGDYDDWRDEQDHQITQVLAFIEEKSDGSRPVILLGDLNTGPTVASAGIPGEWEDHYDRLLASGLTNPYAEQEDVACTSCPDNTFHDATDVPQLIDHVLIKDFTGPMLGERLLLDTITIDVGGEDVVTHLSDHYGLALTLIREPYCE